MNDIFLSYATEDRPTAERLSYALEQLGRSVWWDRNIPPGKTFDQVIAEALDHAKCVVVLWSAASITSDWVKEEATEGLRRRILVPALISDVAIPMGFRRIQAARLTDWKDNKDHAAFNQLAKSISELVGMELSQPPSAPMPLRRVRFFSAWFTRRNSRHPRANKLLRVILAVATIIFVAWAMGLLHF